MFAQKDWKYWITHPDKDFVSNKQDKEADDQIIFNNGKNRPVVILFGWAGCQDKHLLHYSKIYEDQGLITITYSCAFKNLFFENNNMLRIGKEMVEPLKNGNYLKHPIIFHMLSNGGSLQYEVFMKALGKDPLTKQIKGAILDSTPVRRTMLTSFLAIKADLRSGYLRIPTSVLLAVYCLLKGSLEKTYAKLSKTEYVQINPFENLKNEVNRWPQHFIYSTSDHIVSHRDVEEFAGHRRSLGIDVSLKCFENSDHVQHYPKNKLDYARSVIRFINKCLKK